MKSYGIVDGVQIFLKEKPAVLCLRSKEYGALSIQCIRSYLASHIPIYTLSAEQHSFEHIQMQCASSFLGQTQVYFLGDISKYTKQKQSSWYTFMHSYKGPHRLIFWSPNAIQDNTSLLCIDIPDFIDAKSATPIIDCFFIKQRRHLIPLLSQIWCHTTQVSFEQFCIIAAYASIINSPYDQFIQEYIISGFSTNISLFTLSQYFFSKQSQQFYAQWVLCQARYPVAFWTSFWSDQLWRATMFIMYMRAQKHIEAHAIAKSRLPFSFIKADWQRIHPDVLKNHHDYLCSMDFEVKNGGSDVWLELFFMRWFS